VTTGELGCWRAHANVWSHIITSGISSALILEDDADFSVSIREIMEGVSEKLQVATGAKNGETYGLVNGNSWDLLIVGSCLHDLPDKEKNPKAAKMIQAWEDPHAPSSDSFLSFLPESQTKRVRILSPSLGAVCTQGYAVTREGAMRLLYNVGGPGKMLDAAVDLVMAAQMKAGLLKGYLVLPNVIGQWRNGDWRDTDIQQLTSFNYRKGSEAAIEASVREEIGKVLGNRNIWDEIEGKSQEDGKK